MAADSGLSAERADVSGVLCDFHLLDLLTEGSTVSVGREQSAPVLLSYRSSRSLLPIADLVRRWAVFRKGVAHINRLCPNGPRGIPPSRKVASEYIVVEGFCSWVS